MRRFIVLSSAVIIAGCAANVSSDAVTIQGSDTEVQLVSTIVEAFTKEHPGADISVAGGGSAVGIAALINGETDIANSSRTMKPEEIQKAKDKGRNPQEFILARDGLSIIVHPDNPVATLSMEQLGEIFRGTAKNWKDVGGPDAPIVLYGRQSTSGTFGFFRDTVVQGDYAASMRQMEGNQAIVEAVRSDTNAVGYVGVGYIKDENGVVRKDLRIVPIVKDGTAYSPLDRDAVEKELYPIARKIYQYLPEVPAKGSTLEALLRFEASDAGQAIVEDGGFYRLIEADRRHNDAFFETIR